MTPFSEHFWNAFWVNFILFLMFLFAYVYHQSDVVNYFSR